MGRGNCHSCSAKINLIASVVAKKNASKFGKIMKKKNLLMNRESGK